MAQGGFQGTYNVKAKNPSEISPGSWYFGFDCEVCHQRFAVFEDASAGTKPTQFFGDGVIRVACPHCNADRLYKTERVVRFCHEA